ncbi:MAG: M14 family zinc carboxypeptidase [Ilumatobacteraceae bacterium]
MTHRSLWAALLVASQVMVSCASDSGATSPAATTLTATTLTATVPSTVTPAAATPTSTSTTSTSTSTTSTSTSMSVPATTVAPSLITETRVIGQSVQGRDITAYRMGDPSGRPVLLIGVIHGDEAKGLGITQRIRTMPTPAGIDLWIIDSINPDGQAANVRYNANGVDLNRNVSYKWSFIPKTSEDSESSGDAPADQPETQVLQNFVNEIQPRITIFWHQDANRVSPGGARPSIAMRFAEIVGLSSASTPCTGGCTGTFTQYINHTIKDGTAFIVELPGNDEVTPAMVALHAEAALEVMTL